MKTQKASLTINGFSLLLSMSVTREQSNSDKKDESLLNLAVSSNIHDFLTLNTAKGSELGSLVKLYLSSLLTEAFNSALLLTIENVVHSSDHKRSVPALERDFLRISKHIFNSSTTKALLKAFCFTAKEVIESNLNLTKESDLDLNFNFNPAKYSFVGKSDDVSNLAVALKSTLASLELDKNKIISDLTHSKALLVEGTPFEVYAQTLLDAKELPKTEDLLLAENKFLVIAKIITFNNLLGVALSSHDKKALLDISKSVKTSKEDLEFVLKHANSLLEKIPEKELTFAKNIKSYPSSVVMELEDSPVKTYILNLLEA